MSIDTSWLIKLTALKMRKLDAELERLLYLPTYKHDPNRTIDEVRFERMALRFWLDRDLARYGQ